MKHMLEKSSYIKPEETTTTTTQKTRNKRCYKRDSCSEK